MRQWNPEDPRWMARIVDSAEVAATKDAQVVGARRHRRLWACDDDVMSTERSATGTRTARGRGARALGRADVERAVGWRT